MNTISVETKYNIGDGMYIANPDYFCIIPVRIEKIDISINETSHEAYTVYQAINDNDPKKPIKFQFTDKDINETVFDDWDKCNKTMWENHWKKIDRKLKEMEEKQKNSKKVTPKTYPIETLFDIDDILYVADDNIVVPIEVDEINVTIKKPSDEPIVTYHGVYADAEVSDPPEYKFNDDVINYYIFTTYEKAEKAILKRQKGDE